METYRATGTIFIEGTYEEARYDFEIEDWDSDRGRYGAPSEMDVLNYMLEAGIIQIMSEDIELIDEEEE